MTKKIEYEDKVAIQNDESVAEINKVTDADMNEIKEVINNNAEELEQAQKDIQSNTESIEQIKAKDTAQDSLIEKLQTKVVSLEAENTSLKNQIPSGEATGNPIHLTDSSNLPCEIVVIGGAEQETRSGKNKLQLYFSDKTVTGVTITKNEDDSITLNGTATATINFLNLGKFLYEVAKGTFKGCLTYKSGSMKDGSAGLFFSSSTTSGTNKGGTTLEAKNKSFALSSTVTEDANIYPYIYINSGTTFDNFTFYFQVVNSDTDDFDYEQYGAMPSPDYPSPVETVGQNGSVEIEVCNKNFINMKYKKTSWSGASVETEKNKIKFVGNQDGQLGLSYSTEKNSLNLKAGTKISYSSQYIQGELTAGNTYYNLELYYTDGTKELINMSRSTSSFKNDMLVEKVLQKDAAEFLISGSGYEIKGLTTDLIYEFQLEVGNATNIIEHENYTKVLPIQQEMLEGDYIEDVEHHGWGKYEITGNEDWKKSGNPNNISYYLIINSILVNIDGNTFSPSPSGSETKVAIVLSNHFKAISPNQLFEGSENGICLNWVGEKKEMRLGFGLDSDINTVDKLKAWLKSLYDAGTPVIVYYKLATPKSLELTEDQKSVLNSFYTYKNVTNVSMSGIGTLKVNYKKDLETIINKLSATSVAE